MGKIVSNGTHRLTSNNFQILKDIQLTRELLKGCDDRDEVTDI